MSSAVSIAAVSTSVTSGAVRAFVAAEKTSAPKISVAPADSVKIANNNKQGTSKLAGTQDKSAQKTPAPAPPPAPASTAPDLPLGLLLSVGQPPAGNALAKSDYLNMQNALRTDNLSAAQQAYMRLQSDLQLNAATPAATETATAIVHSTLDVTA